MGSMTHNEIYYNLAPSQDQDKLGMRLFRMESRVDAPSHTGSLPSLSWNPSSCQALTIIFQPKS